MQVVINIKGDLHDGDILVYKDGQFFKPTNKNDFLFNIQKQLTELKLENEKLRDEYVILKCGVNEKLENYHKILQTLTKEC